MKILVTGADGMLGNHVVRQLLGRNHEVIAFLEKGKEPRFINELSIETRFGDILNQDELLVATKDCDVVIHCAACTMTWPARNERINQVNIEGTQNIIFACLKNKVKRLIHVGTANSFGFGSKNEPGNEKNDYKADRYGFDYMDSKYLAQNLILEAVANKDLPALIVNPTFMFGAYDAYPNAGKMIIAIAEEKVPACTSGGKNFVNTADVAVGIANAVEMGKVGECYILGNENLTFKEAFGRIAKAVKAKTPKNTLPNFMVKVYGAVSDFISFLTRKEPTVSYKASKVACDEHYYSADKAVRDLKLPQNPIENGIKEFYSWYQTI